MTVRPMTRWARRAALVTLAFTTASCGFSLQSFPKFGGLSGPSYPLHARFANVLNLPANAQVREGSAVIGQVSSISTHHFQADLTFRIRSAVHIPVGSTAQVRFDSPLGDEFILIQGPPGSAKGRSLAPGAVLPESSTGTAPSVEDTLTALGAVLNGGGISSLQTIIVQLNNTLGGHQSQIRELVGQISTALTSLSKSSGDIDGAITAVASLSSQLNAGSDIITSGIDAIAPAVTVLSQENGDLDNLLTQLTNLSSVANQVVATSGQASINDVHQLLPVVNQLEGVEQQLGPDLTDIAAFETETPKIAPGNYLQVGLTVNTNFNSAPQVATAQSVSTATTSGRAVSAILEGGLP
jgi:phospholipid/cholesterol/gamma-HCH transport system substrate-binding protein